MPINKSYAGSIADDAAEELGFTRMNLTTEILAGNLRTHTFVKGNKSIVVAVDYVNEKLQIINEKGEIIMKKNIETKKVASPKKADKAPEMVTLYTFTGMNLGEKEVIKRTAKTITVRTKGGDLTFDAKTGVQTNAKYVKFANKIK